MERVIEKLLDAGYDAELTFVEKVDGKHEAIIVKSAESNISPTIYTESLHSEMVDDMVDEIIDIYEKIRVGGDIDVMSAFKDGKSNLIAVLYPRIISGALTKDYLDLKEVIKLWIPDIPGGTVTVKKEHLELLGLTEEEAFKVAEFNAKKRTLIDGIGNIIPVGAAPMWIYTNEDRVFGGNGLLNKEAMKKFCEDHDLEEMYIIPSSIHELIFLDSNGMSVEDIDELISEVNEAEVAPGEILSDHVYIYNINTNEITY